MTADVANVVRLPERRRSHIQAARPEGRLDLVRSETSRLHQAVREGLLAEMIAAERNPVDDRPRSESQHARGDLSREAADRGGVLDQWLSPAKPEGALGEAADVDRVDAPLDTAAARGLNAFGCGSHRGGYRWFCVQTQPNGEVHAFEQLRNQRFIAFLPLDSQERRSHTRSARRTSIAEAVIAPFFSRYLFVAFDPDIDAWGPIRSTLGVTGMIAHDQGRPAALPRGWIERAILRCDADGVMQIEGRARRATGLRRLKAGDRVEIIGGAFHEFDALVRSSTKTRVQVLMSLFGRQTEIWLNRKQVLSK